MKKNIYENLTNDKLLKMRKLLKGASIVPGIIALLAFATIIYLLIAKGIKNYNIASLIPVFILPITFVPLLINLSLINKEIKLRKL